MELQKGRPADTAGRLEKEIRTYDLLDRLGVAYERVDHAPAMTMEVCQEIDQTLQAVICKNLFLCNRQETAFYLLMIPDTKVSIQGSVCADRRGAPVLCQAGIHGKVSGYYARIGQRAGTDE